MAELTRSNWHALEAQEILSRLGAAQKSGLSSEETQARLKK